MNTQQSLYSSLLLVSFCFVAAAAAAAEGPSNTINKNVFNVTAARSQGPFAYDDIKAMAIDGRGCMRRLRRLKCDPIDFRDLSTAFIYSFLKGPKIQDYWNCCHAYWWIGDDCKKISVSASMQNWLNKNCDHVVYIDCEKDKQHLNLNITCTPP